VVGPRARPSTRVGSQRQVRDGRRARPAGQPTPDCS
jgi:hypothetical protein